MFIEYKYQMVIYQYGFLQYKQYTLKKTSNAPMFKFKFWR